MQKVRKAKFTVTVKAAPTPAKVVTPETVKPVVKDNTAEYTGLVANAEKIRFNSWKTDS